MFLQENLIPFSEITAGRHPSTIALFVGFFLRGGGGVAGRRAMHKAVKRTTIQKPQS